MNTNMNDLTRAIKAAQRLNLEVLQSSGTPLYAKGFMGEQIEALAVIRTGTRYDIGIVREADGTIGLEADWDLIEKTSDLRKETLIQKLKQQYALLTVEETAKAQGLSLSTPVIAEDGSIEVTVNQW